MEKQPKIKIIKRGTEAPEKRAKEIRINSSEPKKPDSAKVVTEWIAEWRKQKSVESSRAFESLFRRAA